MNDSVAMIRGKPAMMYTGQVPWYGRGLELKSPATAAKAIEAAQLNWKVVKVPIHLKVGNRHKAIANKFATVRADALDAKEPVALGIVGTIYTPLQNEAAFNWFDPIVGEGAAVYHTAGALGNGEHVWILVKLPGEIRVAGDDITNKFLLLSNSHDGSSSVRVKFTPIRFACWNMLTMPSGFGARIRVRHTSRLREQMALATNNLGIIEKCFGEIGEHFQAFANVQMNERRLAEYLCEVFPGPTNQSDRRAMNYAAKSRSQAGYLFEMGTGNEQPKVKNTLWAAYNGVTEFIDYGSNLGGPDRHLDSIWFGSGYRTKARAYRIALAKAQAWKN